MPELKLLRKPLPCKKESSALSLNKTKQVKAKEKNLESNNKKKEELYCKDPVAKEYTDLNSPDWIFIKPRGPDPFPIRTCRRPCPLNKGKVIGDTCWFFEDRDNQQWDWKPQQFPGRGVHVIEFGVLPGYENCLKGKIKDQNILTDAIRDDRVEDLNAVVNLDNGASVTNKERQVQLSVLELELPSKVNFRMKKSTFQVLVEEKARQLKQSPFRNGLDIAPSLKDWTTHLEPTFQYNEKCCKRESIDVKECWNQHKMPVPSRKVKPIPHLKEAFKEEYHAWNLSGISEESNTIYAGFEKMDDVTADLPSKTNDTHAEQDNDRKGRKGSASCTLKDLAEEAAFQCLAEGGVYLSLKVYNVDSLPDLSSLHHTLIYLNLSFNNFTKIPEEIFGAKKLEVLKLRNNPIRTISKRIKKLKNLRVLGLSFCRFSEFPPGILQLCSLEHLDLSYNELTILPREIEVLRNLRELNVAGNQLWALPRGILSLNLKSLNCVCNFLHPLLWQENGSPQPQKLADICVTCIAHDEKFNRKLQLPESVASLFAGLSLCDYCAKAKAGQGVKLIKPVVELFGNMNIPIVFYVCSQECRVQLKKATSVAAPLNVEK